MRRRSLHFDPLSVIVSIASAARLARVMSREAADGSSTRRRTSQTQLTSDMSVLPAERNAFSSYFAAPPSAERRARLVYFSLELS
jgi:hypothetical protein